jgi:hypothetical protein
MIGGWLGNATFILASSHIALRSPEIYTQSDVRETRAGQARHQAGEASRRAWIGRQRLSSPLRLAQRFEPEFGRQYAAHAA